MKVEESPLEVLSRAASIVQNEEKSPDVLLTKEVGSSDQNGVNLLGKTETNHRRSPKRCIKQDLLPNKKPKLENKVLSPQQSLLESKVSNSLPLPPPPYMFHVMKTNKHPPQQFPSRDKPSNYLSLPPPYSSFFPRPSVISTTTAPVSKFTEHYSEGKPCSCCNVTFSYHNLMNKNKSEISDEFVLPTVDDHFRKSLGEKYDVSASHQMHEKPSSVDEHFEKALGKTWYNLEYGKCKSS